MNIHKTKTFLFLGLFFAFSFFALQLVPQEAAAADPDPIPPIVFGDPIEKGTIENVLGQVLTTVQAIVAVLAVVFLVIGGILYITSGGSEDRIKLAKAAIWAAIVGLAIAVAAPSFLKEIYEAVGGDVPDGAPAGKRLSEIALNVLDFLLSVVGILATLMLVVGGILYMFAGGTTGSGDKAQASIAKKVITYAIIGLVVAVVSLVLVNAIATTIG